MVMAGKSWEIWPFELFLNCFTAKCTFCPELHSLEERGVRITNAKWRKLSPIVQNCARNGVKLCKTMESTKQHNFAKLWKAQSSTIVQTMEHKAAQLTLRCEMCAWRRSQIRGKVWNGLSTPSTPSTPSTLTTHNGHTEQGGCAVMIVQIMIKNFFWGVTQYTVLTVLRLKASQVLGSSF